MEDKIEVGEYVRTKNGVTGKIVRELSKDYYGKDLIRKSFIVDNNGQIVTWLDLNNEFYKRQNEYLIKYTDYIFKHSKNIIDLIEVGDYVNGKKVTNYYFAGKQKLLVLNNEKVTYEENENFVPQLAIKSIVTKEQFESVEYKV